MRELDCVDRRMEVCEGGTTRCRAHPLAGAVGGGWGGGICKDWCDERHHMVGTRILRGHRGEKGKTEDRPMSLPALPSTGFVKEVKETGQVGCK